MSQGLTFHIDIVFCVDVAMGPTTSLDWVRTRVLSFGPDLIERMAHQGRVASHIRGRIVIFDSCGTDASSVRETPFYTLLPAEQTGEFTDSVSKFVARNSGEADSSVGLQALSAAIDSDWVGDGDIRRHIILMFANNSIHSSDDDAESSPSQTTTTARTSVSHLMQRWEHGLENKLQPHAKRLVLLAPDISPWAVIGDSWSKTVFLPSRDDHVLTSEVWEVILDCCIRAV